jgi:hypothetical protein
MRLLIVVTLFFGGCATLKVSSFCESEGTVIRADQLDGCSWLIETNHGHKLLPVNADDYPLIDRQKIYFSFVPFDGMSICMAEDEIVTLTCFQTKDKITCDDETGWQEISWLSNIIEKQKISMVDRFSWGRYKLYQITHVDGKFTWYHCDGTLICNSLNGCGIPAQDLGDQVTIFLAHR